MHKKWAYYNEHDAYAAQWIRNLIKAGQVAPGEVDERSIEAVQPADISGFAQCHWFAGIAGWSYALRLAGWPDDRPVWTGSCPCQPFSAAGKQRGSNDERHLWPAFFGLIRECRPASVFGEQVAGVAGLAWLDHVCADLESAKYAAAAAALPACSVGAHHRRERLFWVAYAERGAAERERLDVSAKARGAEIEARERQWLRAEPGSGGDSCGMAHADGRNASAERQQRGREQGQQPQDRGTGTMAYGDAPGFGEQRQHRLREDGDAQPGLDADGCRSAGLLGNAGNEGLQIERRFPGISRGASGSGEGQATERAGASTAFCAWADIEWIKCSDGKARPTQRGIFPLAHGSTGGRVAVGSAIGEAAATLTEEQKAHLFSRAGVLRGAGNAIVPQVAAIFVMACADFASC